jgi:hypothetical protein
MYDGGWTWEYTRREAWVVGFLDLAFWIFLFLLF